MDMRLSPVMTLAWLATAAALPAWAQDRTADRARAAEPVELDPITVRPPRNILDESDERLRAMMESMPCLGCDGPPPRRTLAQDAVDFVLAKAEPPNPDREQRIEHRLVNDWRVSEYGPEMEAFR